MDSSGSTPLSGVISFTVGILSPGTSNTCLLYEEFQSYDVTNTNGYFSIEIGSGVGSGKRIVGSDPGLSMAQVFNNNTATQLLGPSSGCPSGYTPATGDSRQVQITLQSASLGTVQLTPNQILSAAPQALVAETLQGLTPTSFIQASGNVSQSNLNTLTGNGDASSLHNHNSLYLVSANSGTNNLGSGTSYSLGSLGLGTQTPVGRLEIIPAGVGQKGEIIQAVAGQTANLFEIQRSDFSVASYFDSGGNLFIGEPASSGQAATKNYVDTHSVTSFNTRNGAITLTASDVATAAGVTTGDLTALAGTSGSIQGQLNTKEPQITVGSTAQYFRGDKTFQTLNTSVVPESGSLYFTNSRAQGAISVAGPLTYSGGVINLPVGNLPIGALAPLAYGVSGGTGYFGLPLSTSQILVGSAVGVAAPVSLSGDASINASGVLTLSSAFAPGVSGGTGIYTKVSVNNRGVVVEGNFLAPADLVGALSGDVVAASTGATVIRIHGMPVGPSGALAVTGPTGGTGNYFLGWNGRWEPMPTRAPAACPAGYSAAPNGAATGPGLVCISGVHGGSSWTTAVTTCMSEGAHLCSVREWFSGCVSGIYSPSGSFEWTGEWGWGGLNNVPLAFSPGSPGPCTLNYNSNAMGPANSNGFRCCL
ncbi:MAG: hypothetical protein HYX41_03845 [Bdellovibrio sp.]|nr:hypothetical protein [Bdellovibrio sp.]